MRDDSNITRWVETTDDLNFLGKSHGDREWSWDQPWLVSNRLSSRYSVRYDAHHQLYQPCFWHGNQGHGIYGWKSYSIKEEAMEACLNHAKEMLAGLTKTIKEMEENEKSCRTSYTTR